MAISAATSSVDRIVKASANNGKSVFDNGKSGVTTTTTWYQGDLICYDTSTHLLRVVAATTDGANLVGIADNQILNGQLYGPYAGLTAVDAAQSSPKFVGPKCGVVALMKLHTGDTIAFGQKVYLSDGDDTQTVSSTSAGTSIGVYQGSGVSSAPAGTQIGVLLIANYPVADAV